jgi:signal transduction histidine kinase
MTDQVEEAWGVRQVLFLVLLTGAALLGNILAPQLFTGFNYLFGSVGVMLVLRLFGIRPALVAALLAAAWCKMLFGYFYPLFWLGFEPLFVGLWLKRRPKDTLVMADAVYWLVAGLPLLFFFFLTILKVPLLGTTTAAFMYCAIGIGNALLATLLLNQFSLERLVWPKRTLPSLTIAQLIFQVLMLAIVLPALVVLVLSGRNRETVIRQEMFDTLDIKARQVGQEVRQKILSGGSYPATFGQEQHKLFNSKGVDKVLKNTQPSLNLHLYLMVNKGEVIASTNPKVVPLSTYNPLNLGEVWKIGPEQLYNILPANNPPVPLWQRAGNSSFVRIHYFPGTPVYAIAETSFAPYHAKILRGHRDALAALLVYLAAGAGIATLVARRIAIPLVQLSKTTTDLPSRLITEDLVWPVSTIVEVGQLVENSKEMSHTLSGQFREIAQINADLENRVAERTRDLSALNQSLCQEIDERVKAERQRDQLLRELQAKNKELEGIIYVSSHDLRSPLVNIQGFSRKLAKSCASLVNTLSDVTVPAEKHQELQQLLKETMPRSVEYITGSVEKMDSLLSGLLRLSRLGRAAITIENLDMNLLMSKITNSLAFQIESAGARITVENLLPCAGDAVQINQVFSNLLDNALKYRSPDRTLEIQVSSTDSVDGVLYCVQDNGIGIHPDYHEQVWEIFHRINPRDIPGEGLGLTASRRILDRLNGDIWLESEEGTGSRFFVKLPAQVT